MFLFLFACFCLQMSVTATTVFDQEDSIMESVTHDASSDVLVANAANAVDLQMASILPSGISIEVLTMRKRTKAKVVENVAGHYSNYLSKVSEPPLLNTTRDNDTNLITRKTTADHMPN